MAIVQNPIIGRTRKKMGNVVFSKSFDQNVIRSKALQVSNPRTEAQTSQREAFAKVVAANKALKTLINLGLGGISKRMSPYSYANKLSLKNAISGEPGNRVVDFTKLVHSTGEIASLENLSKNYDSASGSLSFRWSLGVETESNSPSDLVNIGVYDPDSKVSFTLLQKIERSALEAEIQLNQKQIGPNAVYYIFCTTSKGVKTFKAGSELAGKIK